MKTLQRLILLVLAAVVIVVPAKPTFAAIIGGSEVAWRIDFSQVTPEQKKSSDGLTTS